MTNVGIVGMGFVGSAVREGFCKTHPVYWLDIHKPLAAHYENSYRVFSYDALIKVVGPIFVCVPTPMSSTGECDTSIVESVLNGLDNAAAELHLIKTVILKSTLPPGTTKRLQAGLSHLTLVFNPEFLREVSANEDFKKQDRVVLGSHDLNALKNVVSLYAEALPDAKPMITNSDVAELVKYMTNCFLAVKVAFANEMALFCEKAGIDYAAVRYLATQDPRLGTSHWSVPGPDGHKGFGGSCFPKDLSGMIALAKQHDMLPHTMEGAWETNLSVRPEKDWEQLKGRAVSQ